MEPVFVLHARTEAELDAVGPWVLDSWLEPPTAAGGTLRATLHKAPPADMSALAPSLPRARNHTETSYERPVSCWCA